MIEKTINPEKMKEELLKHHDAAMSFVKQACKDLHNVNRTRFDALMSFYELKGYVDAITNIVKALRNVGYKEFDTTSDSTSCVEMRMTIGDQNITHSFTIWPEDIGVKNIRTILGSFQNEQTRVAVAMNVAVYPSLFTMTYDIDTNKTVLTYVRNHKEPETK